MPDPDLVTCVRDAYEAFDRRDVAPLMSALADDVEWIDPLPDDHPVGGVFRGRADVERYFADLAQVAEIQRFQLTDVLADGDRVVAFIHLESTMRHNGRKFVGDSAHVWTFRDGRVVRYRIYADTAGIMSAYAPT